MNAVTRFHKLQTRVVDGKPLPGYVLFSGAREVAFIHAIRHARIDVLLENFCHNAEYSPQQLMRALLNSEDFNSPIYDKIFRVYYAGEFESELLTRFARETAESAS